MQRSLPFYTPFLLLTILFSCKGSFTECEVVQEWNVQKYKIVESKCGDLVLKFYYRYDVYIDDREKGIGTSRVDSCLFTCQADNEHFLRLNTCDNTVQELKPNKVLLDTKTIDSVTIFSQVLNETQLLTNRQINKFVKDWNNSVTRGYSEEPFDSAFTFFPAYQYKLTVFSNGNQRPFYGYNYLILDSSNWEFEMSKNSQLRYFHNYWKK